DHRHFEFSARQGDDELSVVTFEDVTDRIASQEKIHYMARFDSLTGLANRGHFQDLVSQALARGDRSRKCAMLVVDIDAFKEINDSLGHPVGDGVIYGVAERLAIHASKEVMISRFGGDEFLVFFNTVIDEADLRQRVETICSSIQGKVDVAGHLIEATLSGGAVFADVSEASVDRLMVKADLALYKSKEEGKGSWCIFEDSMDRAFQERQRLKADLRGAIDRGELVVVYQPIINARTLR
ncbi:unnamed protein product, partial [Laminaria digitata]